MPAPLLKVRQRRGHEQQPERPDAQQQRPAQSCIHPGAIDRSRDTTWWMLSIGKLAAGPDAACYYEEAVARGREDYYRGEGEAPGRWLGSGAERLGLVRQVNDGEIGRLLGGAHPSTGGLLGRSLSKGSVGAFDPTFKVPKSVSILAGIAPEHVRAALRECHETAVTDALAHLEREACRARRA